MSLHLSSQQRGCSVNKPDKTQGRAGTLSAFKPSLPHLRMF